MQARYEKDMGYYKFHKLLKTTNKRDAHRLMTFIKLVFKDYNSQFTRT